MCHQQLQTTTIYAAAENMRNAAERAVKQISVWQKQNKRSK